MLKIFVANPNKPNDIRRILFINRAKLAAFLESSLANASGVSGADDYQFESERRMVIE